MTVSSQPAPRVFVSHSHADNAYCREFVAGLRHVGVDVWYDEDNLGWGALRQVIERELQAREHFIAILSPAAVTSEWVNAEIDAALSLLHRGTLRTFLLVTAAPCDVPLLLQRYKRIEAPGRQGYPPSEAAARAAFIVAPELAASISSAGSNVAPIPNAEPPSTAAQSTPVTAQHIMPPDRFPPRFAELGFIPRKSGGIQFIVPPVCDVPAGAFLMGSDSSRDREASDDEQPQHRVTLPAYSIARFPVTVAEYACFVRSGHTQPSKAAHGMDWSTQLTRLDHPVTCITWHDAVAYAAWLAERSGQPWRLPSEAEWEKAARGTDGRIYPWGDTFDKARCNTSESGIKTTTPVDRYPGGASPCGALDLAGNVWEWTVSVKAAYPYTPDVAREAPDSIANRVLRGGSWLYYPRSARAACRLDYRPVGFSGSDGFRLVRAVPGP